jgi:hypothetical protein
MNWRGWVFPLIFIAVGSINSAGYLTGGLEPGRRGEMFGAVSLIIGGFIFAAAVFTSRVILMDDAIEVRDVLGTNRMLFSEIRGKRELVQYGLTGVSSSWKLEQKEDAAPPIDINNSYTFDNVFHEWLDQIPDLDAEDVD